ncbi:hypothetical protein JB92DRAFT_2969461 [Gautieria morchelliformis]|nr:hypothetical protein JB92DRAFT_2969461 [Gautieria morchelliformis]
MAALFSILFSARLSLINVPRIMLTALTGALRRSVGYCISPESFTLPHGSTQSSKNQPILPTVSSDISPDVAAEMASAVSSSSPPWRCTASNTLHMQKKTSSRNSAQESLQHGTPIQTEDEASRALYLLAVNEARRLALRTRRRFDMYGPPDWVDPALSILPNIGLQKDYCHGFIPSQYPFLAPHILISEPLVSDPYPVVAWTSILDSQDHDYGNRLIVAQAPSLGSPLPQVYNPAPQATSTVFADEAPDGTCSASPASDSLPPLDSSSESHSERDSDSDSGSECLTVEDNRAYWKNLREKDCPLLPASTFWIEEDDDDLPELPTDW